jgi:hypothetical protein
MTAIPARSPFAAARTARSPAAPIALLLAALFILCTSFAPVAMATEEPKFESVERDGAFELRLYAPMIVAETWVEGALGEGSNAGFRKIAGYIFGRNRSRTAEGSERIAMTVPVTMQPGTSQKIAMTAPVTTEAAPAPGEAGSRWRMHFVMPSKYTMATLPVPEDPSVTLREIPAQRVAVRTFSGFVTEDRVREETGLLLGWMKERGLEPSAPPQLARYNPPWSIPFMRRNEILVPYR